jgi:hypothetical protein
MKIISREDNLNNAFNIVNSNFTQINEILKELDLIKIESSMSLSEAFNITNSNFSKIKSKLEKKILISSRKSKLKKINEINGNN